MDNDIGNELSTTERGARVILSLTLIMATVAGEGELGIIALVPLAAIYPGITGLLGRDPITSLLGRVLGHAGGKSISPTAAQAT